MAYLRLNRLYKVYPNGVKAVNDFSIDIEDKEFVVFVGPSGCGKSTTLRMIAGLEEITAGELFLEGKLVNDVEPEDRDIAMVFQNYALYPHMTVYENMAFGLKNRKVKDAIIKEKINEAVKILDLEDYLQKKPKEMSGGQRQRVALGRAIVRNPKVFLFDEPLSNLDAKLRASMRSEISKLHKRLATTFIYVTHDQVEAMTMGTRIVVMKDGYVQQIDAPMNLYYKPVNKFVAGFIGTPQMNFFDVTLKREGAQVIIRFNEDSTYKIPFDIVSKIDEKYLNGSKPVILGVRPEHFSISTKKTGLSLAVNFFEELGNEIIIYGDLEKHAQEFKVTEDTSSIIVKADEDVKVSTDKLLHLALKADKIHLFDGKTEETILKEIPSFSTATAQLVGDKLTIFDKSVPAIPILKDFIPANEKVSFLIPPHAFIAGKDFTLPVNKIEEIDGNKLLHISYEDKLLFAFSDEKIKVGDAFKFNLKYDEITIQTGGDTLIEPVSKIAHLTGRLVREKVKVDNKKKTNYYLNINNTKHPLTLERAMRLLDVDGRRSYKKDYHLFFPQSALGIVGSDGVESRVIASADYGHALYTTVQVGGDKIVLKTTKLYANNEVLHLTFDVNNAEIWHDEIDFRIV